MYQKTDRFFWKPRKLKAMKTQTLLKALFVSTILLFIANGMAQDPSGQENKYRVTAYQKGNNQVMSMSNEAQLIPAAVLFIPNAFSPNGDGLNDTFGAIGEGITEYNIQIFNRWGELIFESNDMRTRWDGKHRNEIVPMGVYVYKISARGPDADGRSKKIISETGSVTVVL